MPEYLVTIEVRTHYEIMMKAPSADHIFGYESPDAEKHLDFISLDKLRNPESWVPKPCDRLVFALEVIEGQEPSDSRSPNLEVKDESFNWCTKDLEGEIFNEPS